MGTGAEDCSRWRRKALRWVAHTHSPHRIVPPFSPFPLTFPHPITPHTVSDVGVGHMPLKPQERGLEGSISGGGGVRVGGGVGWAIHRWWWGGSKEVNGMPSGGGRGGKEGGGFQPHFKRFKVPAPSKSGLP